MRIAVPLRDGLLTDHFGESSMLALLDVDRENKRIVQRQDMPTPPHRPGVLPTFIADQGAELVLAGSMGQRARAIFEHRKVQFVAGVTPQPAEEAVMLWLAGKLQADGGECGHGGHDNCDSHGHEHHEHGHEHHGHK